MPVSPIPLTVIGGYLGAGKTTLVNQLLREPGGRRLGVIVNDFGSLAVDAALLDAAARAGGGDGVISLPNGCVCCTVGAGLHEALGELATRPVPPDHIVIEVSGVADPAAAAAWGTVAPFEPSGVVVLAAADAIRRQARDRYVGGEVVRQLAGADLVVVSRTDLVAPDARRDVHRWIDERTGAAPRLDVVDGVVPADVVLGVRTVGRDGLVAAADVDVHADRYRTWVWTCDEPIDRADVDGVIDALGPVLRAKGVLQLRDGTSVLVQVVGRRREITPWPVVPDEAVAPRALVAIALRRPGPTGPA